MPPFSVGVAQVEERLRALRRRLNLLALQDSVYLTGSVLLLAAGLVVVLAMRGQAAVFAFSMWTAATASILAIIAAYLRVRQRWLSIEQVVHLADQRAALEDRLPTLLLDRTRASELKDVLLAQTLAAAPRWDVDVLAPRRVPRSVMLLGASLGALIVTAYFVRPPTPPMTTAAMQPPPPPPFAQPQEHPGATASNGNGGRGPLGNQPGSGQQAAGAAAAGPAPATGAGQAGSDTAPPKHPGATQSGGGTGQRPGDAETNPTGHGDVASDKNQDKMAAQVQDAIRAALGAESLDHRKKEHGSQLPPPGAAPEQQGEPRLARSADAHHDRDAVPRPNSPPQGNERNAPSQPGTGGRAASAGQATDPASAQLFGGQPQQAGNGKPSQNLALKLAAFSSAAQQPSDSQPQRNAAASIPAGNAIARTSEPLTDEQVPDAPVQKADVAPEHEALIRRIFTRDE